MSITPSRILLTAVLATSGSIIGVTARQQTPPAEIYASVYSANSWKEAQFEEIGMYRFSPSGYDRQLVMQDPYLDASGGGVMTDDFYFCTSEMDFGSWTSVTHYIFNPDTWQEIESLADGYSGAVATDMTYDPLTAKVYGCFNNDSEDGYVYGTLDVTNGERFEIAAIDIPWIACSVDKGGNLYAVDMTGDLFKVKKENGQTTLLGNLGVTASRRSSGAIDPRTGIFYVVVTNTVEDPSVDYVKNQSSLYAIDIPSCTATKLYDLADGEAVGGMYIPGPVAEDGAPAAPTDLKLTFVNGSLTGTAQFTVPATTFDGNPAEGEVSYTLRANGSLIGQGKTAFGATPSFEVTLPEAGNYEIELVLSNAVGKSPKVKQSMWIGEDLPLAITNVNLTYSDGKFNLTWDAPAGSQNGGYYDPEAVRYTVTRLPDNEIVARETAETSITDAVEMPQTLTIYSYEVRATYKGVSMLAVTSNIWRLGYMPLPYSHDFTDEESMADYTVIDANNDRAEWYREYDWYIEATDESVAVACYPYSSSSDADDWLVTPPLRFEAGKRYSLTFNVMCQSEDYEERLGVYLGKAPAAEALTQTIIAPKGIVSAVPTPETTSFSVEETGVYYIGFHACSDADKAGIGIRDLKVDTSQAAHDIKASGITVEPEINPGSATEIIVSVENTGSEEAAFDVELFRNGEKTDTKHIDSLPAGESLEVKFEEILSPFHPSTLQYHAVVVYADDENPDDNTTSVVNTTLRLLDNPVATGLSAEVADGNVALSWVAPVLAASAPGEAVTDDFESYTPWAIDGAGDWKFVSLDGAPANPMELAPEIPHLDGTEDIAYIVTDNAGLDSSFAAHSGSKYLMAVYNDDYNDDWVISPELSGEAQAITFWGKSYDDYYLENITVMYSTGSDNIDEFQYADDGTYDEISAEWTQYSATLPEGARYFAIGYVSECKVAFLLDDITYIPAASEPSVTIIGYNLYRNRQKLNELPITATEYTDPDVPEGDHTYHITTVCTHGETVPGEGLPVTVRKSGINGIESSSAASSVRVIGHEIMIANPLHAQVAVHGIDGRVFHTSDAPQQTVTVPAGVYVVTVGRNATKVIVM